MKITVLDGGMGDELEKRLPGPATGLWSAQALLEAPQTVIDVHRDYIAAGADVITTNSYSTNPTYLGKLGVEDRYIELTRLAGRLARQAVADSDRDVLVAGSIPPLSESYRADLVPPAEQSSPIYRELVNALLDDVDMYFCETMSSASEARNAAVQALEYGGGKPVFVSWTLNETAGMGLRSGESVSSAFNAIADLDLAGYLFNCTFPEAIPAALGELRRLTDKPLGCYPNRSNRVDPQWTLDNEVETGVRTDLPVQDFVAHSLRCIEHGASMVGGCCEIDPTDIAALSAAVKQREAL